MSDSLDIVTAFKHCPRCGSGDFSVKNSSLRVCGECSHHHHFNPVCAVGAFLRDSQGRLLFLERANEPSKGMLGVPGGFSDLGESMEVTLAREVFEETGFHIQDERYLCSHTNDYDYRGVVIVTTDVFFTAQIASGDMNLEEGEVSGAHWLEPAAIDLNRIGFESMRYALRRYRELFK